jgi:hypothetical protein
VIQAKILNALVVARKAIAPAAAVSLKAAVIELQGLAKK